MHPCKRIEKFTERTITDPKALKINLKQFRDKGYCVAEGEMVEGSIGIAAPIFNRNNQVKASLSVIAPPGRISGEKIPKIVEKVLEYAKIFTCEASVLSSYNNR